MKRIFAAGAALAVLAGLSLCASAERVRGKVIYGSDDRIDLYQTADKTLLRLADSTVALFDAGAVSTEDGVARLATQTYGELYRLCREEPFYEQVAGASCSGSLVAPDIIMTAGHCVPTAEACPGIKFVFGFSVKKKGVMPTSVPAGEVYGCRELIGREQDGHGADWALVRLDRKVEGHAPLKLNRSGSIKIGTPLVVIGHPSRLPTKIAAGAAVRDASNPGFFVANLDTYGGNSGSAVFNERTGLVEGILVRGENDYVLQGDCHVSNVCPDDGCRGEDVTKISVVADKIAAASHRERVAELQPAIAASLAAVGAEKTPQK